MKNAMREYQRGPETEQRPLSIAVFGPPGAGKSFVVREIAESLGIEEKAQLTFNLSQYESPAELARAFQRVRDIRLNGDTPLVFWDEFDSTIGGQPFGWLRYFLSPMQDGEFADQGVVHPVGRGIYVFAGGTSASFRDFTSGAGDLERTAKKPDFISRLRAYIDVKGPNPESEADEFYMIRRAFLLHSSLLRFAGTIGRGMKFDFDPGVLSAFLLTKSYRHGARSLETIVRQSLFDGKSKFELSSLPPEHILQMHVDVEDFMRHLYS